MSRWTCNLVRSCKPYAPNYGLEVKAHIALVILEGGVPDRPLHGVLQPKVEVFANREH
jgi:hypothetical protein